MTFLSDSRFNQDYLCRIIRQRLVGLEPSNIENVSLRIVREGDLEDGLTLYNLSFIPVVNYKRKRGDNNPVIGMKTYFYNNGHNTDTDVDFNNMVQHIAFSLLRGIEGHMCSLLYEAGKDYVGTLQ